MKSSTALNIAAAAVVFGLCAGCGQTGPLYLPKPAAVRAKAPVIPADPVPAPTPAPSPPVE